MNTRYSFTINTQNKSVVLYVTVKSNTAQPIIIIGRDIFYQNTVYFSRIKTVEGQITLEFPMPMSPADLEVTIYSPHRIPFELGEYHATLMQIKSFWVDSDARKMLEFYGDFAQQAGYLPLGDYINDTEEYIIRYMPNIDGITPARVNRLTGLTKVARDMFINYTVPMRFYILGGHEMCHHIIPTPDEERADKCGWGYYSKLSFPETEAYYAMTKVFHNEDHPRIQKLVREIMFYDFTQRQQNNYV